VESHFREFIFTLFQNRAQEKTSTADCGVLDMNALSGLIFFFFLLSFYSSSLQRLSISFELLSSNRNFLVIYLFHSLLFN